MRVGLITAGSDSPGVNAAIRGFGKAVANTHNMEVLGFRDGYLGLIEDRKVNLLEGNMLSGILTGGGTILGTSRHLPEFMPSPQGPVDRTQEAVDTYHRNDLDALVIIGDRKSQLAAHHLSQAGLNIITMPKSCENDVPRTDKSIGFDTAREIATQAIDRLHTNANATHRIMLVELLGNCSGWLTMGAGLRPFIAAKLPGETFRWWLSLRKPGQRNWSISWSWLPASAPKTPKNKKKLSNASRTTIPRRRFCWRAASAKPRSWKPISPSSVPWSAAAPPPRRIACSPINWRSGACAWR